MMLRTKTLNSTVRNLWRTLWLLALLAAWPGMVSRAEAATIVTLGEASVVALPVGDFLYVHWTEAPEGATLKLELFDDAGDLVADAETVADIDGIVQPTLLWERTGVVGCDPDTVADIDGYRFHRFEVAESILLERVFEIRVSKLKGGVLATAKIRFEPAETIYYFSDAAGCLRTVYDPPEIVRVAIYHLDEEVEKVRFFMLPEFQEPPQIGMPLLDVREEYQEEPQLLSVIPGSTWSLLEPIDEAAVFSLPHADQFYDGVLRLDVESTLDELQPTDITVDPSTYTIVFFSANKGLRVRSSGGDDEGED